jgi:beta-lactamase class A
MRFKKIPKKFFAIPVIILSIGAGFLFGSIYTRGNNPSAAESEKKIEVRQNPGGEYKFINPLLECDVIENVSNKKIAEIKLKVQDLINKEIGQKNINFISVYFRDLNNGPWFGINEKEKFMPGSLLKVSLMMSIFKIAESNPGILQEKILYEGGDSSFEHFKPENKIEPGKIYTIENLIEAMIKYSDNSATFILGQYINQKKVEETYTDLGIEMPLDSQYSLPVRTYASFFRILFNATYLNREMSEKALQLLSQATFENGLKAGVPADTVIAHKFGEKEADENNSNQLHDCGIIYYPQKPYVLCVMTRGNEFEKMANVIKNISSVVYGEINKK